VWEAHGQLESARGRAWQLLAAAEQVPEPRYGVTSVLDADPPVRIPTEMGETVAALDVADILRAALQLAAVLTDLEDRLALPRGFGAFVRQDLEAIMPG
jgi:hypothetical protein